MYRNIAAVALSIALFLGGGSVFAQAQDTIRLTTGKWQPYTSKSAPHCGIASHVVTEGFALVEVEYGFSPWKRARKLT